MYSKAQVSRVCRHACAEYSCGRDFCKLSLMSCLSSHMHLIPTSPFSLFTLRRHGCRWSSEALVYIAQASPIRQKLWCPEEKYFVNKCRYCAVLAWQSDAMRGYRWYNENTINSRWCEVVQGSLHATGVVIHESSKALHSAKDHLLAP